MQLKTNAPATCYIGYGGHKLRKEDKIALNLIFYFATLKTSEQLTLKFSEVGSFIFEFKHS